MSLAQGNNTPTRPRIEPGSPDPEYDALTTRPVRPQKGDYESKRKDTLKFAKEKYFNGHSDTRSVQENFNLIISFIQDSADKHIPSKTSRSVSSVPWITPEIRRKIRKKNENSCKG